MPENEIPSVLRGDIYYVNVLYRSDKKVRITQVNDHQCGVNMKYTPFSFCLVRRIILNKRCLRGIIIYQQNSIGKNVEFLSKRADDTGSCLEGGQRY